MNLYFAVVVASEKNVLEIVNILSRFVITRARELSLVYKLSRLFNYLNKCWKHTWNKR